MSEKRIISISRYYDSLDGMKKKYDRLARKKAFSGATKEEWQEWKADLKKELWSLLGMDLMETCPLLPCCEERITLEDGIVREKVILQVEPEVWMPVYILIPPSEGKEKLSCFLAPHGHQGAGKYTVAGCGEIPAVADAIEKFHYDYGLQLAKLGVVALCPDARGFGERRDLAFQKDEEDCFMRGTCFHQAHMAEPLGLTVAGMCAWDLMRLIDYVQERGEWKMEDLGCLGFSGGGLQTLWLTALDDRIRRALISGYMYGARDALLELNGNCSCNYVPGLWRLADLGDIASLIAPRPLVIQSGICDHLNGARGIVNADEQVDIIRAAYRLNGAEENLLHRHYEGGHQFHGEDLEEDLAWMKVDENQ